MIRGWVALAPMSTHAFPSATYANYTIPHMSFYRASDKTGKRLFERDLSKIPGSYSEIFPSEIDDQERVCAFDNPKLFHLLLINFCHRVQESTETI